MKYDKTERWDKIIIQNLKFKKTCCLILYTHSCLIYLKSKDFDNNPVDSSPPPSRFNRFFELLWFVSVIRPRGPIVEFKRSLESRRPPMIYCYYCNYIYSSSSSSSSRYQYLVTAQSHRHTYHQKRQNCLESFLLRLKTLNNPSRP